MTKASKPRPDSLLQGVVLAHLILLLHVLLPAALAVYFLFFGGIMRYLFWIMLVAGAAGLGAAWLFFRRIRREGRDLREILRTSPFHGRSVEIGVLGGLLSLKIGRPDPAAIEDGRQPPLRRLEDPDVQQFHDLAALGRLLEQELISAEEFDRAKQRLIGSQGGSKVPLSIN